VRLVSNPLVFALLVVIIAVLFGAVHLAPRISNSIDLYNLLINYSRSSNARIDMDLSASYSDHDYKASVPVYITECEGERLSCILLDSTTIYLCGNSIILENGKCYRSDDLNADYSNLLEKAASLFSAVDINVQEVNGIRTYHAAAAGEDAAVLLSAFIPGFDEQISATEIVDISLIVSDGEMSSLSFLWTGGSGRMSAHMNFIGDPETQSIPSEVRTAIADGEYKNADNVDLQLLSLITSWVQLSARDPISADMVLSANAGPVRLNEKLFWQRTGMYTQKLSMISRHGSTLYYTDSALCTDSGLYAAKDDTSRVADALMRLVSKAFIYGDISCREDSGTLVYTISLDEASMAEAAELIAPDTKVLGIKHESGYAELRIEDETVRELYINCRGSLRVVSMDVNTGISARMEFRDDTEFKAPGPEVLKTLGISIK